MRTAATLESMATFFKGCMGVGKKSHHRYFLIHLDFLTNTSKEDECLCVHILPVLCFDQDYSKCHAYNHAVPFYEALIQITPPAQLC